MSYYAKTNDLIQYDKNVLDMPNNMGTAES